MDSKTAKVKNLSSNILMGDNDNLTAQGQDFEKQVGIEKYRLGDQQRYSESMNLQMG